MPICVSSAASTSPLATNIASIWPKLAAKQKPGAFWFTLKTAPGIYEILETGDLKNWQGIAQRLTFWERSL
jgi:hypothetical protein